MEVEEERQEETVGEAQEEPQAEAQEEPQAEAQEEQPAEAQEEQPAPGRHYELIYLVDANLERESIDATADRVKSLVEESGGTFGKTRVTDPRPLAFPVVKRTHGVYIVVDFALEDSQVIPRLERMLVLDDQISRHMIMRTDKS